MLWKCIVSASNHCEGDRQRSSTQDPFNQSIKTHFYSAICRERIRGAWWRKLGRVFTIAISNALIHLATRGRPWINRIGVSSNSIESSTNTSRKFALASQLVFDVPFSRRCTWTQFAFQPAARCDRRLSAMMKINTTCQTTASYAPRFREICDVILTCTGSGGGQWASEWDGQFENRIAKFHP